MTPWGEFLFRCASRAARSVGSCLCAFSRRKPLAASCIAAAVQRNAIEADRHRFTLRQTRRTVLMTFSTLVVQASARRSSFGRPSRMTVRFYRAMADAVLDELHRAMPEQGASA